MALTAASHLCHTHIWDRPRSLDYRQSISQDMAYPYGAKLLSGHRYAHPSLPRCPHVWQHALVLLVYFKEQFAIC